MSSTTTRTSKCKITGVRIAESTAGASSIRGATMLKHNTAVWASCSPVVCNTIESAGRVKKPPLPPLAQMRSGIQRRLGIRGSHHRPVGSQRRPMRGHRDIRPKPTGNLHLLRMPRKRLTIGGTKLELSLLVDFFQVQVSCLTTLLFRLVGDQSCNLIWPLAAGLLFVRRLAF